MPKTHHTKQHEKNKSDDKTTRLSSGIPGLDKLIGGGFIENDTYLITGGTGTGKTLFCCQFLLEGLKKGEKGIYFSLEEIPKDILYDAQSFGWDFKKYIDDGMFLIEYQDPFEMIDITTAVRDKIKKFGAKRVVIDSTSMFGMVFKSEHELRHRLYELIKMLKDLGIVVLMTAEVEDKGDVNTLSRYGVEEFVADGVIVLYYTGIGGEEGNSLQIRKMRRTKHAKGYFQLNFTSKGLEVKGEGISILMK